MIYLYPLYVRYTRNLLLRALCVVYLFVFTSLYVQIPGLYGTNGILPARTQLDWGAKSFPEKLRKPTLLWLAPSIGLNAEYALDVLALAGIFVSSVGFLSQKFCTTTIFVSLWILYMSIYQVGQTFMQSQWDVLLLEVGALAILLAPLRAKGAKHSLPVDGVIFFLLRWLLIRLTVSSGVLKLAKGCSGWWQLSALESFFETQPLPNALSWYAHHLPSWFLRATAVFALVMDITVPLLYFLPIRSIQTVAFLLQIFLQLSIFLTGNHNFYNILSIVLALSLIDDKFFNKSRGSTLSKWISALVCCFVYGALIFGLSKVVSVKFTSETPIEVGIAFTPEDFDKALAFFLPMIIFCATFTFCMTLVDAILRSTDKITSFFTVLFYGALAAFVFGVSVVPFSALHPAANSTEVVSYLRPYHAKINDWHVVNAYGVAEGRGWYPCIAGNRSRIERSEVIIEGANSIEGPWLEYEFLFKPGNVNHTLPFVAPHQPRLDYLMADAAVSDYTKNSWLLSLVYRLLSGQQEVVQLLGFSRNPFPSKPPKYIRASKYIYHFTDWSQRNSLSWWTRDRVGEYFPAFSRDQAALLDKLTSMKILGSSAIEKVTVNSYVKLTLDTIRHYTSKVDPSFLPVTLFIGGCVLIMAPGSKKTKLSGKRK